MRRNQVGRLGLAVLLLVATAALATFLFLHSGFFRLDRIDVQGNRRLSAAELRVMAGIPSGEYLWRVQPAAVAERLRTHPWIESARVERQWPSRLVVRVTEREPLALVPYYRNYLALDRSGVAVAVVDNLQEVKVPVITGANVPQALLGRVYPNPAVNRALACLDALGSDTAKQLSEIHLAPDGSLTLYGFGGLRVDVGQASDLASKMKEFQVIWQNAKAQGLPIRGIDLRYEGQPVVRLKE